MVIISASTFEDVAPNIYIYLYVCMYVRAYVCMYVSIIHLLPIYIYNVRKGEKNVLLPFYVQEMRPMN